MSEHLLAHLTVAVVHWANEDGIAQIICDELADLGHTPLPLYPGDSWDPRVDLIFSYGPYGSYLTIPLQLKAMPPAERPLFIHWNTEGLPDLRLPWFIMRAIGTLRSRLSLWQAAPSHSAWVRKFQQGPLKQIQSRMARFANVGDYHYTAKEGLLNLLADSSTIYAGLHSQHGLPTVVAPWGATRRWYADLGLKRDIDVLWMGKRGTRRRSAILDQVERELKPHGVNFHIADGVRNPFIFDDLRLEYLNRAKITLNIMRTWYDDNYSRFALAAPNRSLIVSETPPPHCPQFRSGEHYVAVPPSQLGATILHYLRHKARREQIVDNAYNMITTELTFRRSIEQIMTAALQQKALRSLTGAASSPSQSGYALSAQSAIRNGS